MARSAQPTRIALACQGGGSHTAFTAGVLQGLLEGKTDDLEIVALSGSSGGAICALLAWDGLIRGDACRAINQLQRFWRYNTASSLLEAFLNYSIQLAVHMRSLVSFPEISPYSYPTWGQQQLRDMLERCVDFAEARALAGKQDTPGLLIGAVDVLNGQFEVFRGPAISADCILASAAIPSLFPAVGLNNHYYWDGLFSQNPPVRELTDYHPDEIWVIQINPQSCARIPRTVDEIDDRRNELAGNLSLEQELRFIEKINEFLRRGNLTDRAYRPITVHRIALKRELDTASKFDRSETFIRGMMASGKAQFKQFLEARQAGQLRSSMR